MTNSNASAPDPWDEDPMPPSDASNADFPADETSGVEARIEEIESLLSAPDQREGDADLSDQSEDIFAELDSLFAPSGEPVEAEGADALAAFGLDDFFPEEAIPVAQEPPASPEPPSSSAPLIPTEDPVGETTAPEPTISAGLPTDAIAASSMPSESAASAPEPTASQPPGVSPTDAGFGPPSEPEPALSPETVLQPPPEPEPGPVFDSETVLQPPTEPEPEPARGPETTLQTPTEPEPALGSETVLQPPAEPEPQPVFGSETVLQPPTEPEPEPARGPETTLQPPSEPEPEPPVEPLAAIPELELEPTPEPEPSVAEPEPEPEPVAAIATPSEPPVPEAVPTPIPASSVPSRSAGGGSGNIPTYRQILNSREKVFGFLFILLTLGGVVGWGLSQGWLKDAITPSPTIQDESSADEEEDEPDSASGDAVPQVAKLDISDVPRDHWGYDYVAAMDQAGIIPPFPDGKFQPDKSVTRAELAASLQQAFAIPSQGDSTSFQDVPADSWAGKAIANAVDTGFMSGYSQDLFRPGENIPRYQVLVSLVSGLELPSPDNAEEILQAYPDAQDLPEWSRGQVAAAHQANLIVSPPADGEGLNPNRPATRAEANAMIYQALVKYGKLEDTVNDAS